MTIADLYNIKIRIETTERIHRQYGQNIEWTQYDYPQLLQLERQLRAKRKFWNKA